MSITSEYAIDRAKNRLDAITKAEGDCSAAVEAAMAALQKAAGCSERDFRRAVEAALDGASDMTFDVRSDLEREIGQHEDDINTEEFLDLERSRPVL